MAALLQLDFQSYTQPDSSLLQSDNASHRSSFSQIQLFIYLYNYLLLLVLQGKGQSSKLKLKPKIKPAHVTTLHLYKSAL